MAEWNLRISESESLTYSSFTDDEPEAHREVTEPRSCSKIGS